MNLSMVEQGLAKSKFRSKFHLSEGDVEYVETKGLNTIRQHSIDFINKKLRKKLPNDGKQTPYKGHPVFKAQHATAVCCRGCISKWYEIPEDVELTDEQVDFLADQIMKWIKKEI